MEPRIGQPTQRLTIYIGERDRLNSEPLYHVLVVKAKEMGMAGATVYRCIEGFGANSRIHTARLLDLSTDLPIVVEIIDSKEHIEMFLPFVNEFVREGLVTIEDVRVFKYSR